MSVTGCSKNPVRARGGASWLLLLLVGVMLPSAGRASLIWETNIGSAIPAASFNPTTANGLATENLTAAYAFPFEGTSYTSVAVASSGFIWLDSSNTNGAQCCGLSSAPAALMEFEQGGPRIIPGWADLQLNLGGSIDFNQISDANGNRSVFTFLNIPTDGTGDKVTFQVQLFTSGKVIFSYMQFDRTSLGTNQGTVIGLTTGADFSPDIVDFTQLPISSTLTSMYDYQSLTSGNFSLSGDSFTFTPNGGNVSGFQVTSTPEPATFISLAGTFFLFAIIRRRQKRIVKC